MAEFTYRITGTEDRYSTLGRPFEYEGAIEAESAPPEEASDG